jgi:tetratricopeptide (TPR) repeat protein
MERMTDREKYRTLGLWFAGPGASYEQAIENFEKLVAAYPADRAGQSNLAFSYFQMLDFANAVKHGEQSIVLYPRNSRSHMNLAIYALFAGDLKKAETEANAALKLSSDQYRAYLPLAAVAFAASDLPRMKAEYEHMRDASPAGASLAAHGLADLAMYQGHWAEAESILQAGIAADEKSSRSVSRASKLVALAEAQLAQNRPAQAIKSAQDAIALTTEESVVVPAALVLVHANRPAQAEEIAKKLAQQFQRRSRAYGAIIEGEIARASGRAVEAKEAFTPAQGLADLWLGRFLLGVTYVEAERYQNAQPELARADTRRGEASAAFLDDVPTFRYLAPLPYWMGRVQEGINPASPAAVENYRKFLALRADDARDQLVVDARKRLGSR